MTNGRRGEPLRHFAASLGISYDTAYKAARDGRLRVVRFGKLLLVPSDEADRVGREGLTRPARKPAHTRRTKRQPANAASVAHAQVGQ